MVTVPRIAELVVWPDGLPAGGLGWCWWDNPEHDFGWLLLLRCPHGHWATLSPTKHQVGAGGAVSPSIDFRGLCTPEPDFHDFGTLAGWGPEDASRWASVRPS